jgi:hypothetical protein
MRKQFLDLEGPREEEISFLDGAQLALEADGTFPATRAGHMIGERLLKTGDG